MSYKYKTVINYIYDKIALNKIKSNQKIPAERDISQRLNVSRTTVKYAIDKLVSDRILYKVHGKGTFVRPNTNQSVMVVDKENPDGFYSNVQSRGMITSSKVVSFKVLYDYHKLNAYFFDTQNFYELIRIRYIQKVPSAIEYCYFPFELFSDANRHDFSKNSLYEYMKSKNRNPVSFLKTIEVVLDKKNSDILLLNNKVPLFFQTYHGKDKSGIPVEYTESYSTSQNLKFGFEIKTI